VVTVTGEGGDALLEAALEAGADDVAAAPEDGAWEVRRMIGCFCLLLRVTVDGTGHMRSAVVGPSSRRFEGSILQY
jgi:hypothetical protein